MDKKFKIKSEVIIERLENSWILLNIKDGKFYELNDSAKFIVDILKEEPTFKEIEKKVAKSFLNSSFEDIDSFLKELLKLGFMEIYE